VQPFGGHGLSGTGPKAGGPLYLRRLLQSRPAWTGMPPYPVPASLAEWLGTDYPAATPLGTEILLPGPVGEENVYRTEPRGAVLCVAASAKALRRQIGAALVTGNRAVVSGTTPTDLPISDHITVVSDPERTEFDAVLFDGDAAALTALCQDIAARPGPIIGVHIAQADGFFPLEWLMQERSVSTNTTAAGGNANLMMIG
jgi:RHH-type proline utilization regulon transcriptional repressor/proline dehydrogenase/delta 1-pyrroline-5-carboxylate dehydrogenase